MKPSIFLILLAVPFLYGGGQGVYTAITNCEPSEFSIEKYLEAKPPAKWLRLTGGVVDMTGATCSRGLGSISEIYVPVKPAGKGPDDDQIHILLATKDPAMLKTVEQMRQLKTEKDMLSFILEHRKEVIIPRQVDGLIRFGIDLRDRDEQNLRRLNPNLATDFIVLADGEQPDRFMSAFFLLCGVALAVWIFKRSLGATSNESSTLPPPLPPAS